MKIALIGYGKMGKTIEKLAVSKGHEIVMTSDSSRPVYIEELKKADIAIEFTRPEAVVNNLFKCADAGIPVVTGTTGWFDRLNEVENYMNSAGGKLLYSSNFSIGVNIFFKLNEYLATIMDRYESYDPVITETHHTEKLDSPSGTGLTLAEDLMFHLRRKTKWVDQTTDEESELSLISYREPDVKGTHEITYSGPNDLISIKHHAKDRNGFALGSILAANWLLEQNSGVYSMRDFLKIK